MTLLAHLHGGKDRLGSLRLDLQVFRPPRFDIICCSPQRARPLMPHQLARPLTPRGLARALSTPSFPASTITSPKTRMQVLQPIQRPHPQLKHDLGHLHVGLDQEPQRTYIHPIHVPQKPLPAAHRR